MSLFNRAIEKRSDSLGFGLPPIPPNGQRGWTGGLGLVGEQDAVSIPAVTTSLRIISNRVSGTPLKAYKQTGNARSQLDVPPTLLVNPFVNGTMIDGLSQICVSLALHGNAYLLITSRDDLMRPTSLYVVHPSQVRVTIDQATGATTYTVAGHLWDPIDICHIRFMTIPGSPTGLSVLEAHRKGFGLSLATEQFGNEFFRNGVTLTGVVTTDEELDDDQIRSVAAQFQQNHGGTHNAHLPAIMQGGLKWQSISVSPEDAQFLLTRDFQNTEIFGIFGIPPHLASAVDKTTSWGSGVSEQNRAFIQYTLDGYFKRIAAAFTAMLPAGVWAEFDTTDLIKPDAAVLAAYIQTMLMNGVFCVDDALQMLNMPPLPNGEGQVRRHPVTISPFDNPIADPPTLPTPVTAPGVPSPDSPNPATSLDGSTK